MGEEVLKALSYLYSCLVTDQYKYPFLLTLPKLLHASGSRTPLLVLDETQSLLMPLMSHSESSQRYVHSTMDDTSRQLASDESSRAHSTL